MEDDDEEEEESMYIGMIPCSWMETSPPITSFGDDESLVFGDGVDDDKFFSLFFIVEFQKFFISLSVRPGNRAEI